MNAKVPNKYALKGGERFSKVRTLMELLNKVKSVVISLKVVKIFPLVFSNLIVFS